MKLSCPPPQVQDYLCHLLFNSLIQKLSIELLLCFRYYNKFRRESKEKTKTKIPALMEFIFYSSGRQTISEKNKKKYLVY